MKWTTLALLSAPLALASQPRPILQLQNDAASFVLAPLADAEVPQDTPSLSVEDFQGIQQKLKEGILHTSERIIDAAAQIFESLDGDAEPEVTSFGAASSASAPPHPRFLDFSSFTILEILNASLHYKPEEDNKPKWKFPWPHKPPTDPSQLPLHRLGWLVNRSVEAQAELVKDGITLLAPDDLALTPPHHRGKKLARMAALEGLDIDAAQHDAEKQLKEEMEHQPMEHPFHSHAFQRKKCKKMMPDAETESVQGDHAALISKIIGVVLKYHTLESVETGWSLAGHSTIATALPLERIHIEPSWALLPIPHPTLKFNFYARKRGLSIKAKNGIIHLISAPLLPPLSPLNKLFLFPTVFSTLTSSIQRAGLASALLPAPHAVVEADHEAIFNEVLGVVKEKGNPFTIFAPTNGAFNKLGFKILALLNLPLPLSQKVFKYVLSYHIVPDIAFYSDYINNKTALSAYEVGEDIDVDVDPAWLEDDDALSTDVVAMEVQLPWHPTPHDPIDTHPPHKHGKVNITRYALPTLLTTSGVNPNATLPVAVVSFRRFGKGPVRRAVLVLPHKEDEEEPEDTHRAWHNAPPPAKPKPIKASVADVPARNGAIHVISNLLRPPRYHRKGADSSVESNKDTKNMHHQFASLFA